MFESLDDPVPFLPDDDFRDTVRRRGASRRARRRAGRAVACSALSLLLLTGSVAGYARVRAAHIDRVSLGSVDQTGTGSAAPVPADPHRVDEPFTALLVGRDGPPGEARADTLLLARVDVPANRLRIVSLPRDLWVAIVDGTGRPLGEDRLGAALGGGRESLVATVNRTFGVTVDHYAEVGYEGFARVVDGVGGVPLVLPGAVRDPFTGISLEAGCHVLDGSQTLALVRSRHLEHRDATGSWSEDRTSDLGRMARQQVVLRALVAAVAPGGPAQGVELARLARDVVDEITLDDELGVGDLVALGAWSRRLAPEAAQTRTPAVTVTTAPSGAAVLALVPGAVEDVQAFLAGVEAPAGGTAGAGTGGSLFGPPVLPEPAPHGC